jgi:hypothetical protein
MNETKTRKKTGGTTSRSPEFEQCVFEAEVAALSSLRLIAAPDPKDDISDDELASFSQGSSFSSQLIRQIIDCIKTI